MQRDAIFVVQDGSLTRLEASAYESEDLLQALVTDFPDLIPGGQINEAEPRRWALIAREIGVPGSEGGSARWSLDHLFVDQDGIPTIVEVKRSNDTRIRREVVGQMLDYAANGVRYWPIDELRESFEATHSPEGANAVLAELVDAETGPDEFWAQVEDNLRSGRIRMLFVADEIPTELQTIIEYLNEQMALAEVLGIEIKQYSGEGLQTLVPRVIGLTAAAKRKRREPSTATYEELIAEALPATQEIALRIPQLAEDNGCTISNTRTALKVSHPSGRTLLLLYPQWNGLELDMVPLRDSGLEEEAALILASLSTLEGRDLPERRPMLDSTTVLDNWDAFAGELFPRYFQAHDRPLGS